MYTESKAQIGSVFGESANSILQIFAGTSNRESQGIPYVMGLHETVLAVYYYHFILLILCKDLGRGVKYIFSSFQLIVLDLYCKSQKCFGKF